MIKRSLTTFEKVGLVAAIGVIIFYIYGIRIYQPVSKRISRLQKEYIELSREVEDLKQMPIDKSIFTTLEDYQKKLEEVKLELTTCQRSLAKEEEVDLILTQISELATISQLKIVDFKPIERSAFGDGMEDQKEVILKRSLYKLEIRGEFKDFKEFLRGLSQISKIVSLEKMELGRKSENEALKIVLLLSI